MPSCCQAQGQLMQGMEQEMPILGESNSENYASRDSEIFSVACSDALITCCIAF